MINIQLTIHVVWTERFTNPNLRHFDQFHSRGEKHNNNNNVPHLFSVKRRLTLRNVQDPDRQPRHGVSQDPLPQPVPGQPADNGQPLPQQVKARPPRAPAPAGELLPEPQAPIGGVVHGAVGLLEAVLRVDAPVHGHRSAHLASLVGGGMFNGVRQRSSSWSQ